MMVFCWMEVGGAFKVNDVGFLASLFLLLLLSWGQHLIGDQACLSETPLRDKIPKPFVLTAFAGKTDLLSKGS